jgi:hypothetical protein
MASVSLWQTETRNFPTTVEVAGSCESICFDFRTVLKILHLQSNPDIPDTQKTLAMLRWFYPHGTPNDVQSALNALVAFISPRKLEVETAQSYARKVRNLPPTKETSLEQEPPTKPQYCFEFDSDEIYVSFLADYGVDLVSDEPMHWYKFLVLFSNLSKDSAFARKLELRTMDISHFKGKERAKISKAQKAVQLPKRLTQAEIEHINYLQSAGVYN